MCRESDKLIPCSCKVSKVKSPKFCWILYCPVFTGYELLGEIVMQAAISHDGERYKISTLRRLSKESNYFDFQVKNGAN